jgi:hypothetical protein
VKVIQKLQRSVDRFYDYFFPFGNGARPKMVRRGRPKILQSPTVTSLSLEKALLDTIKELARADRQSVSRWMTDAASQRLARDHSLRIAFHAVEKEVMAE